MKKIKQLFKNKIIVYTQYYAPAELVKYFNYAGKKYARIAFTNMRKYKNKIPITDVRLNDITGIRKLPSPFKKWCYKMMGLRVKPIFYKIKK